MPSRNEDYEVKKPKKRFKTYRATIHMDKVAMAQLERKAEIQASKKWKFYKCKAIQRSRDIKMDDGRGEEAAVDMWPENFNSALSSRQAHPFNIVHQYSVTTYHRCGRYEIGEREKVVTNIVARGTIYKRPHFEDIIVVHELKTRPYRQVIVGNFTAYEEDLLDRVDSGSGEYSTQFL